MPTSGRGELRLMLSSFLSGVKWPWLGPARPVSASHPQCLAAGTVTARLRECRRRMGPVAMVASATG